MTKQEDVNKTKGIETEPRNESLQKTNYPFVSIIFYFLLVIFVVWIIILLFRGALEFFYPQIIGFGFAMFLIFLFFLRNIRIYTFYNDYISIYAPYKIFNRHREIKIVAIEKIIYSAAHQGCAYFIFKIKESREYRIPYNHNNYWDNSFDFAIKYFKERRIPLHRLGLFGRYDYYDEESNEY
jgi:hypothetical protein